MIEPAEVERLLKARFGDAQLELIDLTGTQDHYQARVVSRAFAGKKPTPGPPAVSSEPAR